MSDAEVDFIDQGFSVPTQEQIDEAARRGVSYGHEFKPTCGAESDGPFTATCNRKKGHRGWHGYVKSSGYVMARWPSDTSQTPGGQK